MKCMDYKYVGVKKLRRQARRRKIMTRILLCVAAVILTGILIAMLVLGITEPREVIAETLSGTESEVILLPEETNEARIIPETDVIASEFKNETLAEIETVPEMEYIGTFTLTAYCNCSICCGKWAGGPTASGVMPTAGRTIAVDKSVIPLGTQVYIEGYGYFTAEDTGSAIKGNRIDVYMDSHEAARWFADGAGKCNAKVWIIREDENNEDF